MKQRIILAIVKWLIQYVPTHHVAKNGGKRKNRITTAGPEDRITG
ncbi:MAG: hypothetical protein WC373_16595 [Smithella sp.]|jgi:hypothetical protein